MGCTNTKQELRDVKKPGPSALKKTNLTDGSKKPKKKVDWRLTESQLLRTQKGCTKLKILHYNDCYNI